MAAFPKLSGYDREALHGITAVLLCFHWVMWHTEEAAAYS